jgi:Zn-dependent metalloprotease
MNCHCFIIPPNVLKRLSKDKSLPEVQRRRYADAVEFEAHWRKLRSLHVSTAGAMRALSAGSPIADAPAITVYNCAKGTTLPGAPLVSPNGSSDPTAQRVSATTTAVAEFYRQVFHRNSVDNLGMTLQSSIHFGVNYNNAFWNGVQMTYGDGDGNIFLDFSSGNDVIGHELTHGVTQHSSQLSYSNEPGGLNESISDVFGSMFRQWQANQTVQQADWLIGSDIMGPGAKAKGFTCLRDMTKPAAKHCIAPQPSRYVQIKPGMDPHLSSGIPNFAFYKAAAAIGGKSWETVGQIWYRALTGFKPSPQMKMKTFANRTRKLARTMFAANASVYAAVDKAWTAVGL